MCAQLADMKEARGSLAVVALQGRVYALGGGQPGVNLDSIEVPAPSFLEPRLLLPGCL